MTVLKNYPNMLDLVGVQEVRWEAGGTEAVGEYTFLFSWKME
jgi:hypothetical protein